MFFILTVSSCSAVATMFCDTELTRVVINENLRARKREKGNCDESSMSGEDQDISSDAKIDLYPLPCALLRSYAKNHTCAVPRRPIEYLLPNVSDGDTLEKNDTLRCDDALTRFFAGNFISHKTQRYRGRLTTFLSQTRSSSTVHHPVPAGGALGLGDPPRRPRPNRRCH